MSTQHAKPIPPELSEDESAARTGDLELILEEIAREETPERLLKLARELQAALAARKASSPEQ